MFRNTHIALASFTWVVAFALLAGCASASPDETKGPSYDRKVLIGVNTRIVNVESGELVKFVVQGPDSADRSFTWDFGRAREAVEDLGKFAPAGMLSHPVRVVIGPNPRY